MVTETHKYFPLLWLDGIGSVLWKKTEDFAWQNLMNCIFLDSLPSRHTVRLSHCQRWTGWVEKQEGSLPVETRLIFRPTWFLMVNQYVHSQNQVMLWFSLKLFKASGNENQQSSHGVAGHFFVQVFMSSPAVAVHPYLVLSICAMPAQSHPCYASSQEQLKKPLCIVTNNFLDV